MAKREACQPVLKRVITVVILAFFLIYPASSFAGDDVMGKTLHDSLYGALIGALAGAAVMALSDEPEDNVEYIPIGAAIGVLAGTAYGFSRSVVETSDGETGDEEVMVAEAPVIENFKIYDGRTETVEFVSVINIVRYDF